MIDLVFTTERPRENGYYYVIWTEVDDPELVWIDYFTLDGEEFWTWRWDPSDDPEDLFLDILNPDNIQFSQIINLK
ncbi:hypothetical protein FY557_17660 [Chryseobacterium sp. SN22]|uniref:hypothetical protein n=1 Tax=Chryseobacterium sp. SN22 TaxID=2606431 RepID=UPI0011ED8D67|nr:hypothetical protein [Chryseobacterium sp. SN22]KAA0126477.1 hypothetical protein FY557_17660 [Chryseobacterium sp. SN22]